MWPFTKRAEPETEKRSSMSGFTAELMSARESYISGRRGIAELTGTTQMCVSLWEGGLALADIEGTPLLSRRHMAMAGRALALRGEAVFLIRDTGQVVPCSDWDLSTRDGVPRAYRVSIAEAGGGKTQTALAAEVLHFRTGVDGVVPWAGSAPLKRAQLTAGMLQAVETALSEAYDDMPLGSQIVPMPESPETDNETLSRSFRGRRGRILLRESVNVTAGGGPAPAQDWKPSDLSPDLSRSMTRESLDAARASILGVFGVLPGLLSSTTTGPMVREAQRHVAQWVLQPMAALMAEEASEKLGAPVAIDVMRPLQAFDAGGRARAAAGIVQALAQAKEAGVDPELAMKLVSWGANDAAA
ncbi:phage portal protein [Maritimibacter sp. DP07]|uniref:Phage portal protein n=1 Tax=Maritimibacter harenae TaxID=2606218 RepID=A0A845MA04_9RHOB|nr:phage portal protein [Maritimibacter harenae]MZR15037.1 phage portal protein [Maritimibacter harenae]